MAAVVVAELGVLLLRPRGPMPEPVPVDASDHFTRSQIERAEDFREGQRLLLLAGIGVQGGVLAVLALAPPRGVRRSLERASRRPLLGAAGVGAALSLTLGLATLPTGIWAHERSVDVGLSTQDLGGWLTDAAKASGIGLVLSAAGAGLLVGAVRRWPRGWPLSAAAGGTAIAVVFSWLAPVVLAPIFNDFDPLPEGRARSEVMELAERADVRIGEVYVIDASRRSTALNAYVGGLGPTKRVVLFDTLLKRAEPGELRAVVAHELAHQKERDVQRGIAWIAIAAPGAMLLAAELARRLARRRGVELGTPAGLPVLALSLTLVVSAMSVVGNQLSRDIEAKADAVALGLTRDPDSLIALHERLAVENVGDPDPPALFHAVFGTHPTTLERIGAAKAAGRP